ncbi:CocE/NonD family hydrolase [Streptomyces sp. V2I9]|uniref:CocE/NonD family hydrolase n=1 Tax=Streptomyces sp. V2I9 TaxID=3042304 RepID=UPI00278A7361|nr:CocE/NonD family hydrolase [Streptomyces sp. V2I9]MDQ0986263.1 putative CocE/NonD family hydrolase [Streptomyces sp. V2I9]
MNITTAFPYETTREDVYIPLPDGTRLYARIWRPLTDEPVPALLEYLPHRLSDGTAPRDRQRHPWYAGHGYASVRVDVRGHGNSEGLPGDAYGAQGLGDGAAVVHWLAQQEWCSGRVGMFGISWGGSIALRIAALAPEPLKAIVTVCAADDRHGEDAPVADGSLLAVDTPARAATPLAFVCRPPDPAHAGDDWKQMWLERLESVEPRVHTRASRRNRDADGTPGGTAEGHGAIKAHVLAVGGWHDPYRDTVLRLVEHLDPGQVRGIIGPWSHQYPDQGLPPGPAIGFLQETLRWWDQHLKGKETGVMREPLLRSWISGPYPPATVYETLPGRWVGDASWPSENVTPVAYALQGGERIVASPQQTGLDAGRFVPLGDDADLPPDQRDEDAKSVSFEFPVADAPIEILGRPRVKLRIRMDVPHGQAVARLCDVAPDGASTLITRGALDLTARHGSDRADGWTPGETRTVVFDLDGVGHAFAPGHRIRIAVSSAYWPWIWPRAESAGFTLDADGSFVELPVRRHTEDPAITFGEPEQSAPLGVAHPVTLEEPRPERLVVRDVGRGEWRLEVAPCHGGTRVHPDGLECTEEALETYTIQQDDPLSARTRSDWRIRLHRPEAAWDVSVESRSEITADEHDFIASDEVVCKDGEEIVFHRTWERRIPRTTG